LSNVPRILLSIAVATLGVTQKPTGLLISVSASIATKFFFHESAR
jgi:hypothetical protein